MKPSEILIAAKKLIDSPEKWTQGTLARDIHGNPILLDDSEVSCFCSLGALKKLELNTLYVSQREARVYLIRSARIIDLSDTDIVEFNDTHTYEQVMQMWDKAIQLALTDEQATPNT